MCRPDSHITYGSPSFTLERFIYITQIHVNVIYIPHDTTVQNGDQYKTPSQKQQKGAIFSFIASFSADNGDEKTNCLPICSTARSS